MPTFTQCDTGSLRFRLPRQKLLNHGERSWQTKLHAVAFVRSVTARASGLSTTRRPTRRYRKNVRTVSGRFKQGCSERANSMSALPLFDRVFDGTPAPTGKALTGAELRDAGIQQALDHLERVKAEYIETCLEKIKELKSGTLITSEDLRGLAGDPPLGCENSIAGILKRAASKKYGLIVHTGEDRPAKRPSIHSKNLAIWRRV